MKAIVLLSVFLLSVSAEKARFDQYRVHRIIPRTAEQVKLLRNLEMTNEYNFWTESKIIDVPVDIMVPPHKRDEFKDFIEVNNLEEKLKIKNVQSLIDDEELVLRTRDSGMEWKSYHTLTEIYSWLDELAKKFPKNVKVVIAGKTYEGRQIKGIEIINGANYTEVFLESGIHAREWIGPAGTTYMINEILKSTADPVFRRFNYLYFPVFNPDGYQYSWSTNRMWRKTRTPYKQDDRLCYGADPNRNWGFHWNESGSSSFPCSEIYAGPKAFSEIETKTASDFLKANSKKRRQDIFLTFHSYSQLLMYPWSYTTEPTKNEKLFHKVATAAAKDLTAVHGTEFEVGSVAKTIYRSGGTSIDWYYQEFNGTVPFVYEMRDDGDYGFILPPQFIIPSGQEHLASLRRILLEYEALKKK